MNVAYDVLAPELGAAGSWPWRFRRWPLRRRPGLRQSRYVGGEQERAARAEGLRRASDQAQYPEHRDPDQDGRGERFQDCRRAPEGTESVPEKMRTEMASVNTEMEKSLGEILKPDQVKRLHQIHVQTLGVAAFVMPPVADELKLTDDQKTKIREINTASRPAVRRRLGRPDPGSPGQPRRGAEEVCRSPQRCTRQGSSPADRRSEDNLEGPDWRAVRGEIRTAGGTLIQLNLSQDPMPSLPPGALLGAPGGDLALHVSRREFPHRRRNSLR